MKKINLLLSLLLIGFTSHAQTTVWSDNFDDEDISDWTLTDSDGDSNNWGDLFAIGDGAGGFVTPVSLISRSWQSVPLTPDNWAVSPAIDLSGASGTITVNWVTQVAAASWDQEKYSVHVGTSSDIATLVNSMTSMTEILGLTDDLGAPTNHSLDISAFAGESMVYVAFRHFDVTDMDFISIDDLTVEAATLSINEFDANSFSFNYNKNLKTLELDSSNFAMTNIEIYSLQGQSVLSKSLSNTNESIDVSSLNVGLYLVEVSINDNIKTIKFVKH